MSITQIAAARGVGAGTINCHLSAARAAGIMPRKKAKAFEAGIKMGNFSEAVYGMPPHVKAWVQGNIPDGATVAEFFAAIVVDVANEELER